MDVIGCVIVGYVLTWTANHEPDRWRLLMATGFCGAFTTFSAFAYESVSYWHEGQIGAFMLNILANNVLCLCFCSWWESNIIGEIGIVYG